MMYYMGIDVGSLTSDAVVVDQQGACVAWQVVPTGARNQHAIEKVRKAALQQAQIQSDQIAAVIATGYGRDRVSDRLDSVTEITCHARGVNKLMPQARLVIDIGGQDSKVIRLSDAGKVVEFAMNDKCAAGTGRFLEAMARALEVRVEELGDLDQNGNSDLTLSSTCTVFAETEVVSLIAEGAPPEHIAHGLHRAVASRTHSMIMRIASDFHQLPIAMSGGVARNSGVVGALRDLLGAPVTVAPHPDTVGALGAALIARDRCL